MAEETNEETGTKRELRSTKRELKSTKRDVQQKNEELLRTKRELRSTKRIKDTSEEYWDFGAPGDYIVKTDADPIIISASSIRVLVGGQLNISTDTGRWFLFAPGTWKSVQPKQPYPETLEHMVIDQVNIVLGERGEGDGWQLFQDAYERWKKERGAA